MMVTTLILSHHHLTQGRERPIVIGDLLLPLLLQDEQSIEALNGDPCPQIYPEEHPLGEPHPLPPGEPLPLICHVEDHPVDSTHPLEFHPLGVGGETCLLMISCMGPHRQEVQVGEGTQCPLLIHLGDAHPQWVGTGLHRLHKDE